MQRSTDTDAVFAANRAVGSVSFDTALADGVTRRGRVHEAGSLRVRFPSPEASGLSAVLVNTAGGVAGGDAFDVAIEAGAGSTVTLTTAAAEKIYRSHGPAATLGVSLKIRPRAHLAWLPQETILFDRAKLSRRIDIDMDDTASLLLAEIVVFGRTAMNETMTTGEYVDRWRIRRGGRLVFAETLRLDGDIAAAFAQPAVARGGSAIATVLVAPADEDLVARIRQEAAAFAGEVGVSCWNGFALVRFCAKDAAGLRRDVMRVLARIDADALPRLWLN